MGTELKRFTISISPDLREGLEKLKKARFCNISQSEMFRYLISLGLETFKCKTKPQKSNLKEL